MLKSTQVTELNRLSDTIRVLVIDDDEADYFSVKRMLGKSVATKYQSHYVSTYDDAVVELKSKKYDAVLLDYFIGGKSAKDVYDALDGRWNVPVIIFTGSSDNEIEDRVLEAGAFDFINKNSMCPESLMLSIRFAIRRFEIDERIQARQQVLLENCKNAEAANFSKSEFLSFLGDEIKTPLNAIIGFSQALREASRKKDVPEEFNTYSSTIFDSSSHLMNLIEDLLELSQTGPEQFDARDRRFKRFRTWILDTQGIQERAAAAAEAPPKRPAMRHQTSRTG